MEPLNTKGKIGNKGRKHNKIAIRKVELLLFATGMLGLGAITGSSITAAIKNTEIKKIQAFQDGNEQIEDYLNTLETIGVMSPEIKASIGDLNKIESCEELKKSTQFFLNVLMCHDLGLDINDAELLSFQNRAYDYDEDYYFVNIKKKNEFHYDEVISKYGDLDEIGKEIARFEYKVYKVDAEKADLNVLKGQIIPEIASFIEKLLDEKSYPTGKVY